MNVGQDRKAIGDLCEVIAGQSPEGKYYNSDRKGMPFYQGKKEFGERYIKTPSTWTTRVTKIAIEGDVLMSVRAPVGPINYSTQVACIGRGLAAIRCGQDLDRDYLYYQLLYMQPEIAGKDGAVFSSINKGDIERLSIAYVSLPEQRRIVGVLDEAFAGLATARAHAAQNLQNARALFDSHLNAVFTRRGEGWVEDGLQSLTTKIGSGATPRGGKTSYKTEGVSLIRSLNVHDMGFRYEKLAFLDDTQADGLSSVAVQERDVLLNITGASVARCCLAPADVLPARVNQHVTIIRPIGDKLSPEFLHYLLISRPYKTLLLGIGEEGGSTRQAINKAQIQNFKVAHPKTLAEQQELVTHLDALAADTQRLERIYEHKQSALEELKKSLLHQAFTGNL